MFNVGDKVRRISAESADMPLGSVWTVARVVDEQTISLENDPYEGYLRSVRYFEKVEVPQLEVISYQIYWKSSPDAIHVQIYASTDERQSERYIGSVRRVYANAVILGKKKIKVKFPL